MPITKETMEEAMARVRDVAWSKKPFVPAYGLIGGDLYVNEYGVWTLQDDPKQAQQRAHKFY